MHACGREARVAKTKQTRDLERRIAEAERKLGDSQSSLTQASQMISELRGEAVALSEKRAAAHDTIREKNAGKHVGESG